MDSKNSRVIGRWLLIGAILVFLQILLGGITRLTGSGLSIVHWEVVTGIIPPLNEEQWDEAFAAYQDSPQGSINPFSCSCDFKEIYLWEWGHRLMGRIIGLYFLVPFVIFFVKKRMSPALSRKAGFAILLVVAIGILGWFMVRSGLIDRPMVSPYLLVAHLGLTLFTMSYVLWLALAQLAWKNSEPTSRSLKRAAVRVLVALSIQVVLGALMSGTKAAHFFTTWPSMHGHIIPPNLFDFDTGYYPVTFIQFFHRLMAYVLVILIALFVIRASREKLDQGLRMHVVIGLPMMVLLQITLGILTLRGAHAGVIPIDRALPHQALAVIMLMSMVYVLYKLRSRPSPAHEASIVNEIS